MSNDTEIISKQKTAKTGKYSDEELGAESIKVSIIDRGETYLVRSRGKSIDHSANPSKRCSENGSKECSVDR